jgi:hypothetical protein
MEQPTFHAQAAGREQSFGEAAVRKALTRISHQGIGKRPPFMA